MRRVALVAVLGCAVLAPGQPVAPTAPAGPRVTIESVAPANQALVRQRSRQFYRMPDGSIWDGWHFAEYRRVLDRNLKPFDRVEPGQAAPNQFIVEGRPVGTVWKIKPGLESTAWALEENLADEEGLVGGAPGQDQRFRARGLETVDPHTWEATPPLWSSLQGPDFTWPMAYVDETEPDDYTRKRHGSYLEITRIWGKDRYEFKGYALDTGEIDGIVTVPDPARYVKDDRFKGRFFLWPEGQEEIGGKGRRLWRLIPADEARMTPDDLAAALLAGKAEIVTWEFEKVRGKPMWKRSVRDIQEAVVRPDRPPVKSTPPPTFSDAGPDLVVLKDGRWFRGRVTKSDDAEVVILTRVGELEAPMTFKRAEVLEVQAPERR